MRTAWVLLVVLPGLAGCFGSESGTQPEAPALVPVGDRFMQPYVLEADWSSTLAPGIYSIRDPVSAFVEVMLPTDELGAAADPLAGPRIHIGLFLPDVPAGTRVPVIADIGPYYGEADVAADERGATRLGEFLISNFVPHGFAVAQVSVFGSGKSNHCMDLMGRSEQLGIDAAVTWLGAQDWSNGNVGLIGRSYDGSTPWQAAMFGNPALKTIVPISGLTGWHDLMWRNGSAEFRAPIMHNVAYGFYGIDTVTVDVFAVPPIQAVNDPDAEDRQTLCRDYLLGLPQGGAAYATGDYVAPQANDYWTERAFLERALANYQGSIYVVHGLQDWNVDPHLAFPTYGMLQEAGLEVKGLFGQWAHNYPDRLAEHESCDRRDRCVAPQSVRMDWAQDLLEWFDHYLRDGPKPELHVEVQDNQGAWRIEATYPPRDVMPLELPFSSAAWTADASPDGRPLIAGGRVLGRGATSTALVEFPPLGDHDTRLAGWVHMPLTVTPTTAGGQVFAELRDSDGRHLGHAIMELRYATGSMQPVAAGQSMQAPMQFEVMDVVVPAGKGLHIYFAATGEDYLPPATQSAVQLHMDASTLVLPVLERAPEAFFEPPSPRG
jgi:hypothetical protein